MERVKGQSKPHYDVAHLILEPMFLSSICVILHLTVSMIQPRLHFYHSQPGNSCLVNNKGLKKNERHAIGLTDPAYQ